MKERIELGGSIPTGDRRFVARSSGTQFVMRQAEAGFTDIDLYDEISPWGVSARDFRSRLKDASGRVRLRINSPGGIVTEGVAIYNDLVDYKGGVDVHVTGLAASMASLIAMAGDTITIAENAFFMIHNPWGVAIGDEAEMAAVAEILRKMGDSMARTYSARTGSGIRSVKEMMAKETWLTAKEAVEAGFADKIADKTEAKAKFDLSMFANAPDAAQATADELDVIETETDIEKQLMRDAGPRSRSQARALIQAIKAGKTSATEAMPGAGGVRLDGLHAAVKAANEAFQQSR